jgi:exopolysaccharide production protein ExoZ
VKDVSTKQLKEDLIDVDDTIPIIKKANKLAFIQFLRGIAALLVLLHHATIGGVGYRFGQPFCYGLFKDGWAGVDFFFVLSGFIIVYIHSGDIGVHGKLKTFVLKRLVRIFPVYWIALLPLIPAVLLFPYLRPASSTDVLVVIKSFFLFPQSSPILSVSWTLSCELLFYSLFALLIYKWRLFLPAIVIWIIGIFYNVLGMIKNANKYLHIVN